jgi:hypothetical protein
LKGPSSKSSPDSFKSFFDEKIKDKTFIEDTVSNNKKSSS